MQLTEAELERFRQSGVKLDADGRFWHEGEMIAHAGMIAAFWRWLARSLTMDIAYPSSLRVETSTMIL